MAFIGCGSSQFVRLLAGDGICWMKHGSAVGADDGRATRCKVSRRLIEGWIHWTTSRSTKCKMILSRKIVPPRTSFVCPAKMSDEVPRGATYFVSGILWKSSPEQVSARINWRDVILVSFQKKSGPSPGFLKIVERKEACDQKLKSKNYSLTTFVT